MDFLHSNTATCSQLCLLFLLPVSGPATAFSTTSELPLIKYSNSFSLIFGNEREDKLLTTYDVSVQLTGGK